MAMSPLHGCQSAAGGTREFCSFSFFFQVVSFRRRGPGGPVLLFIPLPESDSESDASDYSVPGLRTESDSDASDCRRRGRRDGSKIRFQRYSTLPKTVLLQSQYLQSYDDLLQILA